MDNIKVVLADDQAMFRQSLSSWFGARSKALVVGEADSVAGLLDLCLRLAPEAIFLSPDMAGEPFSAAKRLLRLHPDCAIVFLGSNFNECHLRQAIECRARGYLLKTQSLAELLAGLGAIAHGDYCFAPRCRERLELVGGRPVLLGAAMTLHPLLTPREVEVIRLLADGLSVKQVANVLGISYKTVDNQTCSLMRKLGIHSRAELVRYAIRQELSTV